jgi:predicted DNA-binding ribbon-helix-helix protein
VNSGLETALYLRLKQIVAENDLTTTAIYARDLFRELLHALSKNGKVVVLIDEYDAPMMHYLGINTSLALENRDVLKEFYTVLKENDRCVEMVFITGVSKFAKVGIFSGLNNFSDISMHRDFATMFGYTQAELEDNFGEYFDVIASEMSITKTELLDKMRFWYNGYRFDVKCQKVYNPISTNSFFDAREFKNFWFETGTPTYLLNHLRENPIYKFSAEATPETAFNSFEMEHLNTYGLLYQTGYLTIKGVDELGFYILDYPNYEVEKSMTGHLLDVGCSEKRKKFFVLLY